MEKQKKSHKDWLLVILGVLSIGFIISGIETLLDETNFNSEEAYARFFLGLVLIIVIIIIIRKGKKKKATAQEEVKNIFQQKPQPIIAFNQPNPLKEEVKNNLQQENMFFSTFDVLLENANSQNYQRELLAVLNAILNKKKKEVQEKEAHFKDRLFMQKSSDVISERITKETVTQMYDDIPLPTSPPPEFKRGFRKYEVAVNIVAPFQEIEDFIITEPLPIINQSPYFSEKIPVKQKIILEEPYATFAKMRKVGIHNSYSEDIFYEQAIFMKDFTDNYITSKPLDAYYTTYSDMDDEQLRTYFTWRKNVRQGSVVITSTSYVYCYINELINNVGVSSADEGINKLLKIWKDYRKYDLKIDYRLREWIRDFYVVNYTKITSSYEDILKRYPIPCESCTVFINKLKQGKWDIGFVERNSTYKITGKQFYKSGNQKIIEDCLSEVLQAIYVFLKEKNYNFHEVFISVREEKYYTPFGNAVYVPQNTAIHICNHVQKHDL
jgi:DNA-binding transcriptional MerR regulator